MDDPHYMKLRFESLDEWRALDEAARPGCHLGRLRRLHGRRKQSGDGWRSRPDNLPLRAILRALDRKALKEISPEIDPGNLVEATFSDVNGHVDPVHVTERFVAAAKQAGARIIHPCSVTAIEPSNKVSGGVKPSHRKA